MSDKKLSTVIYDSKAIIPAPMVSLNRSTSRTEDGHGVGHSMTATLTGKLVSTKGWDFSGNSIKYYSGSNYPADANEASVGKFDNILQMQDVVRSTFRLDNEYKWFEIQSLECASPGVAHRWLARVQDVQFKEGLWVETCEYIITLELVNSIKEYGDDKTAKLMSNTQHSEKWDMQFDEERGGAYKLTHTLSCNAKQYISDSDESIIDGWVVAKEWIDERLLSLDEAERTHIDGEIYNFSSVLDGTGAYNYERSENIDQLSGNYTVVETWLLSKYPVIYDVAIEFTRNRDTDSTVKVHGRFKHFNNANMSNIDDAIDAFNLWEDEGRPFILAEETYGKKGPRYLNSCPVTRIVTRNIQYGLPNKEMIGKENFNGDFTEANGILLCSNELSRTVDFNFEYSDGSNPLYDAEINISSKKNNIAASEGCSTTITIDGNIQGHKCSSGEIDEALSNAQTYLDNLDLDTMARSAYTGLNESLLQIISSSISKNERKGTIHFTYEYSDLYEDGIRKEETITESWSCETRDSAGEALKIITVDGILTGLCDIKFANMSDSIPPVGYYEQDCGILTKSSINKDEYHKKITYNYTFEQDCGKSRQIVDITIKNGPEKRSITYYTLNVQFNGIGCTNAIALVNAESDFNQFNPFSHGVPAGICQLSKTVVKSNIGKITATYEFADYSESECGTQSCTTEITVTTKINNVASELCANNISVDGNIQGNACGDNSSTGQINNALTCFNNMDIEGMARELYTGNNSGLLTLISSSVTKDSCKGSIHFTNEYSDIYTGGIRIDETRSESWSCETRNSKGEALKITTIDGTITALCGVEFNSLVGAIPPSSDYASNCDILTKSSINKDINHKKVTYNYTFEQECGLARRTVDVTIKNGPEKRSITYYTVSAQFDGIGCTDSMALANAYSDLSSFNPTSYGVPSKACQLSKTTVTNSHGKITATYEFADYADSECGDAGATTEITVTSKENYIPTSEMCSNTVTVDGTIQGNVCGDSGGTGQMTNAENAYASIDASSMATSAYTGSKSLTLVSRSVSKESCKGTIHFTEEYSDLYASGVRKEETITESFSCETRNSEGAALRITTVDGVLTGLCSVGFGDVVGQIPEAGEYAPDCGILTKSSINKDEYHNKVTYNYSFEEDCGGAKTTIDVTTKNGPDKCQFKFYTINAQFDGLGCTDSAACNNAEAALGAFNPESHGVPATACKISESISRNNHGKITASYEYGDFGGTAEVSVNTTTSFDSSDCSVTKTSISGSIKGCCGAAGGGFAAAQEAYDALNPESLCANVGFITSRSKTDNEKEGTINFTIECQKRKKAYIEEKSIGVKYDIESSYNTITIDGSITPICKIGASEDEDTQSAQVAAGQAAWSEVKGSLKDIASGYCDSEASVTLKRSSEQISQINGKVVYSYEYACITCQIFKGALESSLEIIDNIGAQSIAIVPILGRSCGPLIQDKGSRGPSTYTINVTVKFKPDCCAIGIPDGIQEGIADIIDSVNATHKSAGGCGVTNIYEVSNTKNWNPCAGKFTQSITNMMASC